MKLSNLSWRMVKEKMICALDCYKKLLKKLIDGWKRSEMSLKVNQKYLATLTVTLAIKVILKLIDFAAPDERLGNSASLYTGNLYILILMLEMN